MLERAWPTLISLFIFRFQRSKFIIRAVPSICDVADARKINFSYSGPIHVARKRNRAFQTSIIRVDSIQIEYLVLLYSDLWGIFRLFAIERSEWASTLGKTTAKSFFCPHFHSAFSVRVFILQQLFSFWVRFPLTMVSSEGKFLFQYNTINWNQESMFRNFLAI